MLLMMWIWYLLRLGCMIDAHIWQGPDKPRMLWHEFHPYLWSECFYAVGVILAFIRVNSLGEFVIYRYRSYHNLVMGILYNDNLKEEYT